MLLQGVLVLLESEVSSEKERARVARVEERNKSCLMVKELGPRESSDEREA